MHTHLPLLLQISFITFNAISGAMAYSNHHWEAEHIHVFHICGQTALRAGTAWKRCEYPYFYLHFEMQLGR